jgi:hypothetical protein
MGVQIVDCPVCGADVRIGIPQGSSVERVHETAERSSAEGTKVRPLSCPDDHDFAVEFTIG